MKKNIVLFSILISLVFGSFVGCASLPKKELASTGNQKLDYELNRKMSFLDKQLLLSLPDPTNIDEIKIVDANLNYICRFKDAASPYDLYFFIYDIQKDRAITMIIYHDCRKDGIGCDLDDNCNIVGDYVYYKPLSEFYCFR